MSIGNGRAGIPVASYEVSGPTLATFANLLCNKSRPSGTYKLPYDNPSHLFGINSSPHAPVALHDQETNFQMAPAGLRTGSAAHHVVLGIVWSFVFKLKCYQMNASVQRLVETIKITGSHIYLSTYSTELIMADRDLNRATRSCLRVPLKPLIYITACQGMAEDCPVAAECFSLTLSLSWGDEYKPGHSCSAEDAMKPNLVLT